MASKIIAVKRGTNPALMVGDLVKTTVVPYRNGRVIKLDGETATIRPVGEGSHQALELPLKDIQKLRKRDALTVEVGCRVRVRNGTLKGFGTLQSVDGAYHYIRYGGDPDNVLELYPGEFRVVAVYRHPEFVPGTVVRFAEPDKIVWGKSVRRTTHGVVAGVTDSQIVVQPMGSRALLFLLEDALVVETGKSAESGSLAEKDLLKLAIRALLVTCGGMMVVQLTGLLATQGQKEDAVKTALFELVAEGKVGIDESHVMISSLDMDEIVDQSIRETLFASTEAVRKAKSALADAVFKTIADIGARLPR